MRKLLLENNRLQEIVVHRRHLKIVDFCLPGEKAWGVAKFKEDPKHHLGLPILLGTEMEQALLEIAEVAIRSKPEWLGLKFIGFHSDVKWRQKVPIKETLLLPVMAKRIFHRSRNSNSPIKIYGKIKTALFNTNRDEELTESIISFELE